MIPIIPNVFTGPSHEASPSPIRSVTAVEEPDRVPRRLVLRVHLRRGTRGSAPTRPMSKSTRVVAFWIAMQTASAELITAIRMMIHAPPQSRAAEVEDLVGAREVLQVVGPVRRPGRPS